MANKQIFKIHDHQMENLVDTLNKASDDYYNDVETMSNKEYDELFDKLKQMEQDKGYVMPNSPTVNVGAPVKGELPKFKHPYPALSLDKTKDVNEIKHKFKAGIAKLSTKSSALSDTVVAMYKEDGSTVQAYYKQGYLDKLVTPSVP